MRYSKRELNGLPVPEEIVISNLSKYIALFADGKYDGFLFRGENTNYNSTVSSALRSYQPTPENLHDKYPFIKMKDEFKREVSHMINSDEHESFLAFSQHYGIPTNLVDFTKSPLVALYFACQPFNSVDKKFDNTRGFVYLMPNDLIDITDIIEKHEDENILNLLVSKDSEVLVEFYKKIVSYRQNHPSKFQAYFKKLVEEYDYHFKEIFLSVGTDLSLPEKKKARETIQKQCIHICDDSLEYVSLAYAFLKNIIEYDAVVWWINGIPNFTYTPILSFERGRNQQGLFVYQAFLSFIEGAYDAPIVSQQRIWPDKIIVVENKKQILKELDRIGINDKFIYGDYDSIARYIREKYISKST